MSAARRLVALGCLLAVISTGCSEAPGRPNVIVVTFDTTRMDRIGAYGYDQPTSTNVDRLAAEGTLFTNAYTTNPVTLPSHTSLFTGTYPPYHGVRDNSAFRVRDDLTTMAEVLSDEGYETAAFVAAFVLDSQFNLDQGFETYDDEVERDWSRDEIERRIADAFGFAERKANLVTKAALDWLDGRDDDRPFFAWLHYFDPHEPKNPPEPHRSLLADAYDAEIAIADEQLGVFLDELRARGLDENTWIVFTADHGEGLLDHGEPTHALLVFNTTMKVPLVIRPPGGQAPVRDDRLASIVDVKPTILDRLGLPIPESVQGQVLLGTESWGDRRPVYMESLIGRLQHGWGDQRALRMGPYKLIHGPKPRLFNIEEDPDEVFDLARREPDVVASMTREMQRRLSEWADPNAGDGARIAADPEAIKKLASLGYLTQTNAPVTIGEDLSGQEGLIDPYEARHLFDLAGAAQESIRKGEVLRAISFLEEVLSADPDNPYSLTAIGSAYLIYGRNDDRAAEYLERALEADPRNEQAHYLLARVLTQRGELQAAQEHCEAILEINPTSHYALYELGRIYQIRGEIPRAREHFEAVLDVDDSNVVALLALGLLHFGQQENDAAERYLARALQQEPSNPEVLYNQGVLFLQTGRLRAAAENFRLAISINGADAGSHYALARTLIEQEAWSEARTAIQRALTIAGHTPPRIGQLRSWLAAIPAE